MPHVHQENVKRVSITHIMRLWGAQGNPSSRSENGKGNRERRLTWLWLGPFLHNKRGGDGVSRFEPLGPEEAALQLINLPGFGAEGKEEGLRLYQPINIKKWR